MAGWNSLSTSTYNDRNIGNPNLWLIRGPSIIEFSSPPNIFDIQVAWGQNRPKILLKSLQNYRIQIPPKIFITFFQKKRSFWELRVKMKELRGNLKVIRGNVKEIRGKLKELRCTMQEIWGIMKEIEGHKRKNEGHKMKIECQKNEISNFWKIANKKSTCFLIKNCIKKCNKTIAQRG